jgi:rRNA processing protein Gar1
MSFSGRVNRESHLGGLLVDFEGRPPRLGARIRISGGKILGRVDTVIGPVESALIHVHPLYDGIDARASVGSPVEIAPRESGRQGRPQRRNSGGSFRDNKGGGNRGRGPGGQGGRNFRDNKGGGNRGRGPNKSGRKPGNSGRRRDSGKSGRGNRRR